MKRNATLAKYSLSAIAISLLWGCSSGRVVVPYQQPPISTLNPPDPSGPITACTIGAPTFLKWVYYQPANGKAAYYPTFKFPIGLSSGQVLVGVNSTPVGLAYAEQNDFGQILLLPSTSAYTIQFGVGPSTSAVSGVCSQNVDYNSLVANLPAAPTTSTNSGTTPFYSYPSLPYWLYSNYSYNPYSSIPYYSLPEIYSITTPVTTLPTWSAKNTGAVFTGVGSWTSVPGLTLNFSLTGTSQVRLNSSGVLRSGTGQACVAFRFTVDGNPRGNSEYGQRVLCAPDQTVIYWNNFVLDSTETLSAGIHNVKVEVRNYFGSPVSICGDYGSAIYRDYATCSLNVSAN